jgi:hypothetical protein
MSIGWCGGDKVQFHLFTMAVIAFEELKRTRNLMQNNLQLVTGSLITQK